VSKCGVFSGASLVWLLGYLVVGVGTAEAQMVSHAPEVRFIAGTVKTYLDEPAESMIGGGLRFALTSRLSLEPEVLRVTGTRFESWHIFANVRYALSTNARVAPYVVVGVGVDRELDKAIDYYSSSRALNGGFGVRIALTDRVFISPEGRFGLSSIPRLTVALGVALR
jgi:opacity protein-like surface antigen